MPSREEVLSALSTIKDPDLDRDVVSLGMIKDLTVEGGRVSFTFELTTPACPVRDQFQTLARELVGGLPGVASVDVKMTSNVRAGIASQRSGAAVAGVKHVIAIGSGKGGVGKSTVAVNVAASLQLSGARVGLLDGDVYGPSVPGMLGVAGEPKVVDQRIVPLEAYGMKFISIGLLAGADKAMVWRGPMVSRALEQMLTDVRWGDLDYLVVDLPPGTGDVPLTLAQSVALSGVAIVCTPQDAALKIAVKALQMFRGLNVPALGLIENMSWFVCGRCGEEHHIFDHGQAELAARRLGVPYLGGIPLEAAIREAADAGSPVVVSRPDAAGAQALRKVTSALAARLAVQSHRQLPVISVR